MEDYIHISSIIAEEDIEREAKKLLELSDEDLNITLRQMGRGFGKTQLNRRIFEKYLELL